MRQRKRRTTKSAQPYLLVGSGRLTATICKDGSEKSGWSYRFNIIRTNRSTGHVTQRFSPRDLRPLARLVQLLASVLADDGCTSADVQSELRRLALYLDRGLRRAHNASRDDDEAVKTAELVEAVREILRSRAEQSSRQTATNDSGETSSDRQFATLERWLTDIERPKSTADANHCGGQPR